MGKGLSNVAPLCSLYIYFNLCFFRDRPSINSVLKKPIISQRINKFLSDEVSNAEPRNISSEKNLLIDNFFLKEVMLHFKLKEMKHRTPCKQIFCSYTHHYSWDEVKRSKHFFLKVVMLHTCIKLNGKKCRTTCKQKSFTSHAHTHAHTHTHT